MRKCGVFVCSCVGPVGRVEGDGGTGRVFVCRARGRVGGGGGHRSWVMATTVPPKSFRVLSSQATDSASKWLVGSSTYAAAPRPPRHRPSPEQLQSVRVHHHLDRAITSLLRLGIDVNTGRVEISLHNSRFVHTTQLTTVACPQCQTRTKTYVVGTSLRTCAGQA